MPDDMRWLLELMNYGALGVFATFCLVAAWRVGGALWQLLFSREGGQEGIVIKVADSAVKRNEKMSMFMDTLADREVKQQELCHMHNSELVQIRGTMEQHTQDAKAGFHDIVLVKGLCRQACQMARTLAKNEWPSSRHEVEQICKDIEERIDNA